MSNEKNVIGHDIRIIRLAKWQIPKTNSITSYAQDTTYLSVGYFDMVDVVEVNMTEKMHPLLAAYESSHRHPKKKNKTIRMLTENYTMQELIVFTDIIENEFTQDDIRHFWKNSSPIMFVSLIHIDNENKIKDILKKIRDTFSGQTYMYYFSFDYSGIILLAKEMDFRTFLDLMFKLNYANSGEKKLIRDTYSFYGFNKKVLKKYFEKIQAIEKDDSANKKEELDKVLRRFSAKNNENDYFSVSINVGIQNYQVYQHLINDIKLLNPQIEEYSLFGRHDCSIVNDKADVKWLIYIQYLLDKYTIETSKLPKDHLLSTRETFVKVPNIGAFIDTNNHNEDKSYQKAAKKLEELCDTFLEQLDKNKKLYNGEYGIPIQAVRYSILSILKNRFAEDFVWCMYQSFCEFLVYLTEKMTHKNDDIEEFDRCFNYYFRGLNSLVNSAMHSERQFIQATAFNAIIYDVPSKIMAFYVAMINKFQLLMHGEKDKQYTFLLTPSFSNEISVKIISYKREKVPHNRILMVSINERSLYNPRAVARRMAHEVAHFAGDQLRCRELRKKQMKYSVIYIVLSHVMHGCFVQSYDFYELIKGIEQEISKNKQYTDETYNYSEQLFEYIPNILNEFLLNPKLKEQLKIYIGNILDIYLCGNYKELGIDKNDMHRLRVYLAYISTGNTVVLNSILDDDYYFTQKFSNIEKDILVRLILDDIQNELLNISWDSTQGAKETKVMRGLISRFGSGILNRKSIAEYTKVLLSSYSEAFSDIQMILLTGITYQKYLEGFINDERIDIEGLSRRMEDLSRISMVTLVMRFVRVWDDAGQGDIFKEPAEANINDLKMFHEKIEQEISVLKCTILDETKDKVERYAQVLRKDSEETLDQFFKLDTLSIQNVDNVRFYTNEKLFVYLLECTQRSIRQYNSEKKKGEVSKLKKMIRAVSEFHDIKNVFSMISEEIKLYETWLLDMEP